MDDFMYYNEIDSGYLREAPQTQALKADSEPRLVVDPASTAFIDGSMVEALLRQTR